MTFLPNIPSLRIVVVTAIIAFAGQGCSDDTSPEPAASEAEAVSESADSSADSSTDSDHGSETPDPEGEASDSTVVEATSGYLGSYVLVDDEFGTSVTVTVDGSVRTIESNSLPNHETGEFPNAGNPNEITEQELFYEFTTEPVYTGNATFAQASGVGVNGIAMEPGTGESVACESGENYRIEALQDLYNLGLDVNNAHVQPGGQYHYHGLSQFLVEAFDTDEDLIHVGFAADGFLMYYSKSAAYDTGYELVSEPRTGTNCTYRGESVEIDGTIPDGTYVSDWVHTDNGDLDECMGTEIDGVYAYVIGQSYPYISRCLNGEYTDVRPAGGQGPDGAQGPDDAQGADDGQDVEGDAPGQGGAPGQGDMPDLDAAAAQLGIGVDELMAALGRPADLDAAAVTLGISVEVLAEALGVPAS